MALRNHLHMKPVELKVFIIFAYAVLISIISVAATTVGVRNAEDLEDDLTEYYKCEAFGCKFWIYVSKKLQLCSGKN